MLTFDEAKHEYQWNGQRVPGVTSVLRDVGIVNYDFLPPTVREFALDRGRYVHQATHFDDEGELDEPTVASEVAPFLEAWRKFRKETGFQPHLIECPQYQSEFGYAGIPDRTGKIGTSNVIVDLKCNIAGQYAEVQLVAYSRFFERPRSYRLIAVELKANATYCAVEVHPSRYQNLWNVWASALNVWRYQQSMGVALRRVAA